MASFNQTIVIGNLGRDPELKFLASGDPVCNFSVAVSEKWNDKSGESKEQTTWFRVATFRKLAEICGQYLKKGSSVQLVGKMVCREYQKDGVNRESWELHADRMQMLGGRGDGSDGQRSEQNGGRSASRPSQPASNSSGAGAFDDMSDDIPF